MISKLKFSNLFAFSLVLLAGTFALIAFKAGDRGWARTFITGAMGLALSTLFALQKQAKEKRERDRYGEILGKVSEITTGLDGIKLFLEEEQEKIHEAKQLVSDLEQEKARLEPIISCDQATIEAVLAVYAKRNSRLAWKSHVLAFAMGVISSLIASYLFLFMHR